MADWGGKLDKIPIPRHCSFGKRGTGMTTAAKLDQSMVKDIRRSARREWFGLPRESQARLAQQHYPVHTHTLLDIITNRSWYDVTYECDTPDLTFWCGSFGIFFLFVRTCANR